MTKRYRNPVQRSLLDENWDGGDDGHEYIGPHRLRRNKIDGILGGVCAGIGDYLGMDPVIVRVIFIALVFTGLSILAYPILWLIIPSDKRAPYHREYRESRRARRKAKSSGRRRSRAAYEESPVVRTSTFRDVKSKFRSLEERLQDLERSVTSKEWRLNREFRDLEN